MAQRMLNITYKDRKTNIMVRERIKVIDIEIISNLRTMKWSWAGYINRLKNDLDTACLNTGHYGCLMMMMIAFQNKYEIDSPRINNTGNDRLEPVGLSNRSLFYQFACVCV